MPGRPVLLRQMYDPIPLVSAPLLPRRLLDTTEKGFYFCKSRRQKVYEFYKLEPTSIYMVKRDGIRAITFAIISHIECSVATVYDGRE